MSAYDLIRFLENLSCETSIVFGDGRLIIAESRPTPDGRPKLRLVDQKEIETWLSQNPAS